MNLAEHFRRWFAKTPGAADQQDLERLRAEFSARYNCFNDLLSANKKALEAIAEMELARGSREEPGMALVRRLATNAMVSVRRMIGDLEALAPDRYTGLLPRFTDIQQSLEAVLAPAKPDRDGPLVLPLDRLGPQGRALTGPKMASLGHIAGELGLPVPPGVVITTAAYGLLLAHNDLEDEIARRLQLADLESTEGLFEASSAIQALFLRAKIPDELASEVDMALESMAAADPADLRLALRSSAWGEDEAGSSFAGQFASELNVDPGHWQEAYLQVVASLYSPSAVAYRLRVGLRDDDAAMAVGCLAMIRAAAGGVVYTADPLNPDREVILINSSWGLPKAVVDGAWDSDQFTVEPGPPPRLAEAHIAYKPKLYYCDSAEGVLPEKLPQDKAMAPSLGEDRALELAGLAAKLAEHYGGPQDVEWALDRDGRLFILQCRPLPVSRAASQPGLAATGAEVLAAGGVAASPGAGAGPVRWVRTGADSVAFEVGEVLAVEQPLPRWAPLLGRAAALVSVRGGLAGHLASVAREFGVPALLGLGEACRSLDAGHEVTVDAGGRTVYRGRLEIPAHPDAAEAVPDTPLRRTLERVVELSAPLNLLDPEDRGFSPQACRTLHDITRFCHQKAVEEMFSQAAREHFPLNAARKLFYKVPMQWWILDLGGGVAEGADGKYVHLEHIVCRPFHAFWEGLTEVPWDGPPALDGRGMASVMFQAASNPALGGGPKGGFVESNYFLITREFMNLQSRVGFHFSSIEASVGDNPPENFVSFCFRGGAADQQRRQARLAFLEGFMVRLGMQAETKGDALLARIEGATATESLAVVKALGYLVMHTRQLDMIMANPERVAQYRQKLNQDLDSLRPPA